MNYKRVVITGIGVVSPNGVGKSAFTDSLINGKSGLTFIPELQEKEFRCQVGGIPVLRDSDKQLLDKYDLQQTTTYLQYALLAALLAWEDARLPIPDDDSITVDYETGSIIGSGFAGIDLIGNKLIPAVDNNKLKKLRTNLIEQMMFNSPSTHLTRILGLGNVNYAVSNACATSTDALIMGFEHIKRGNATRMAVGGADCYSPYYWGLFDLMRILAPNYNQQPEKASRPMSQSACGFVPGAGGAVLVLEELEAAKNRNATIYAELCGGAMNTGGQRNGGSMTAPNSEAIIRCIEKAIDNSGICTDEIDLISGHLTATKADALEIKNWKTALQRNYNDFPFINSLKSMTGHLLGGAGALETAAALIQMNEGFVHPNLNCEDLNPLIEECINPDSIPMTAVRKEINCTIKASFGFGDVNSCLVIKKI